MVSPTIFAQQPSIVAIENNYSYTSPALPNYGIAPGSLFVIFGTNLANTTVPVLQSSAAPGVPLSLNGVTVSVSSSGQTLNVPLYYVSATQIAGILPSSVPPGTGNVTVSNNGQVSSPVPIQVVPSDFGILTANNNGSGSAAAYDASNSLLTGTNSASPGQTIVLWGSGVGADSGNDDRLYPQNQNNLTNIPMQVYIGGISAPILYRGRSQFPGVDQIDVTVPPNVTPGCYVSLVVLSGTSVSNSTTLAVNPNGGACSDPNTEFSSSQLQGLSDKSNVAIGTIFLDQETDVSKNVTRSVFKGKFRGYSKAQFAAKGPSEGFITYGSCHILAPSTNPAHLDAGSALTISGPGGEQASASLNTLKNGTLGDYRSSLPSGFVLGGGSTFAFTNGSGSSAIGPLSGASITMPSPITWTNMNSISTINRSQGATITWSGGSPNTFVAIQGSAAVPGSTTDTVDFACAVPVGAGQFSIPPDVLLAMPGGTGQLTVNNVSFPAPFSAPGLDLGTVFAEVGWKTVVAYQ